MTAAGPKTFFLFHLRGSPRELINAGVKKVELKKCTHSFTSGGSGINYTGMKKAELKKDARFFHSRWRGLGFINCGGERKNWGPTRPRFMSESGTAQNRWKTISKTAFWNNANPVPEMLMNTVEFYIISMTLCENVLHLTVKTIRITMISWQGNEMFQIMIFPWANLWCGMT